MNIFYSDEIATGKTFSLAMDESVHCTQVLRKKTGDIILLTNGKGGFFEGEIISDKTKNCIIKVIKELADPLKSSYRLTLAIAPTKSNDRFEWFLEKATEIGCHEIIPLHCKHAERTVIKTDRLNKVLISAMKQCLKSELPKLHELHSFDAFLESSAHFKGQKFIGHIPELSNSEFPPNKPTFDFLSSFYKKGNDILIAIGPEGGFSNEEISKAIKNDFIPISLGPSRLRVETAGVAACVIASALNQ